MQKNFDPKRAIWKRSGKKIFQLLPYVTLCYPQLLPCKALLTRVVTLVTLLYIKSRENKKKGG